MQVLFPETSQYFLGSVGRRKMIFYFTQKKYEHRSKYPEYRRKILICPKKFSVGPKKVGSVGFSETRLFFLA